MLYLYRSLFYATTISFPIYLISFAFNDKWTHQLGSNSVIGYLTNMLWNLASGGGDGDSVATMHSEQYQEMSKHMLSSSSNHRMNRLNFHGRPKCLIIIFYYKIQGENNKSSSKKYATDKTITWKTEIHIPSSHPFLSEIKYTC